MTWKAIVSSAIGTSHKKTCTPCQDAGNIKVVENHNLIIGAVADGAGSAAYSEIGSSLAVNTILEYLEHKSNYIASCSEAELEKALRDSVQHTRSTIEDFASSQHLEFQDFACTLLVFVATPKCFSAMQIGDGFIIIRRGECEDYEIVFSPDKGEYANVTSFITSPTFSDDLQIEILSNNEMEFIFLSTDGVERLAAHLKGQEWIPYEEFLRPLEEHILREPDLVLARNKLEAFLDSKKINAQTDDDKTILLCCNLNSSGQDSNWIEEITRLSSESEKILDSKIRKGRENGKLNTTKAGTSRSFSLDHLERGGARREVQNYGIIENSSPDNLPENPRLSTRNTSKQHSSNQLKIDGEEEKISLEQVKYEIFKSIHEMGRKVRSLKVSKNYLKTEILVLLHHKEDESVEIKLMQIVRERIKPYTEHEDFEVIIKDERLKSISERTSAKPSKRNRLHKLNWIAYSAIFLAVILGAIVRNLGIGSPEVDTYMSVLLQKLLMLSLILLLILLARYILKHGKN